MQSLRGREMLLKEMEENFTDVGACFIVVWGLNHTMFRYLVRLTLSLLLDWYFNLYCIRFAARPGCTAGLI